MTYALTPQERETAEKLAELAAVGWKHGNGGMVELACVLNAAIARAVRVVREGGKDAA